VEVAVVDTEFGFATTAGVDDEVEVDEELVEYEVEVEVASGAGDSTDNGTRDTLTSTSAFLPPLLLPPPSPPSS
jgi:hypothetical protein